MERVEVVETSSFGWKPNILAVELHPQADKNIRNLKFEFHKNTNYPNEEILFNDKTAINSELDIYFPRLKLAFELNGIFHYEPIYGKEKLRQIQNNDQRKFFLCQQKGISLCVIDASKENYFKVERSKKYLDIIIDIFKSTRLDSNQ